MVAWLFLVLVGTWSQSRVLALDEAGSSATCTEEPSLSSTDGEIRHGAAMMQVRGYSSHLDSQLTVAFDKVDQSPAAECGGGAQYAGPVDNKKCKQDSKKRLFKEKNVPNVTACFNLCKSQSGCTQFSYNDVSGDQFYQDCMGCVDSDWADHVPFKGYFMCPDTTTVATTTTTTPVPTTPSANCGPQDPPYYFAARDAKCPYSHELRLFTHANVLTLAQCYERCLSMTGCANFAWASSGDYRFVCMGCLEDSGHADHERFNFYHMCQVAATSQDPAVCKLPSAEFKVCTGWGDPHYSTSFTQSQTNFDSHALGVYKLAGTVNSTFQMQVFQCPFTDHAASIAGLAWRMGNTVLSVIDNVVAVNGTNITHGGNLIDQETTFPSDLDIMGSPSAGGVIFQSSDTCVRVRVQRHSMRSARAGYILHEQLLIASGFAAPVGMCGAIGEQEPLPTTDYLFTGDQVSLLCSHCHLEGCTPEDDGIPRLSVPASYIPVYTAEDACRETRFPLANATAACVGLQDDAVYFEACRFDYCASSGDEAVVSNAVLAQWEDTAATAGVGLKPFGFRPLPEGQPVEFFGSALQTLADHPGTCAKISDIHKSNQTDCSPMATYSCDSFDGPAVLNLNDGESQLQLGFTGRVQSPIEACGEPASQCHKWNKYKTCGGVCARTLFGVVQGGTCVRGEYETLYTPYNETDVEHDWYEVGIGLYDEQDAILQTILKRGKRLFPSYFQFRVAQTQSVYVMIMSASYDYNGNGLVGQTLQVRNLVHGPCLSETQVRLGPKECIVDGSNAELNEFGYFLLAECCCDLEMEIYVRRVMEQEQLQECQRGTIEGMVPYYTCVHGTQSYEAIRADLWRQTTYENCKAAGFENCDNQTDCEAFAPRSADCSQVKTSGCPSVVWIESETPKIPCGRFR